MGCSGGEDADRINLFQKGEAMSRPWIYALGASTIALVMATADAQAFDDATADEASRLRAGALGEIVVTARKVEENLQDIPLSITAFGAEQIERDALRTVDDVARMMAGITFDIGGFPNDTRPAMRGMQAERGRPSVAILLDGQDLSGENLSIAGGTSAINTGLFDLERIEVVRGPQATLYGRNAFAGAINYVTREPSFNFGARISGEIATDDHYVISGSVTGPLVADKLAFRANVNWRDFGGYYRHPVNGGALGAVEQQGFAASMLFTPTEELKVIARYQYQEEEASDNPTAFVGANVRLPVPGGRFTAGPPGSPSQACPPSLTGLPAAAVAACTRGTLVGRIDADISDVQTSLNPITGQPPFGMKMHQHLGSLDASWDTEIGVFSYRFGFQRNESDIEQDGDFSSFPAPPGMVLSINAMQRLFYTNEHVDNEFRWQHQLGRFSWIGGIQWFTETSKLTNSSQFWLRGGTASPLAGPRFRLSTAPLASPTFPVQISRKTDYIGLFAGASVEVIDGLKVSVDVRYNEDEIDYVVSGWRRQDVSLSRLTPTCIPGFPNGATFSPTAPATSPPPGVVVACEQSGRVSENAWTPRATIEYKWTDDLLTYASYAKGFKPGGFNTNEIVTLNDQRYSKETVEAWEVGIKSTWLGGRLVLNADAYWNDYTDQQIGVQQSLPGAGGQVVTTAGIVNAGKVKIKGFEFEGQWQPVDALTLGMSYAYTDATFKEYIQGPAPGSPAAAFAACGVPSNQTSSDQNRAEAGNLCGDFSGSRVGKNPKHSLNVNAAVRLPLGETGGDWLIELGGLYRSKRFTDESNLAWLPSYWLWNAKAGVEFANWQVIGYVDNLFDSKKITSAQRNVDFGNPEGFAPGRAFIAYLPRPQQFGLRATLKFQ